MSGLRKLIAAVEPWYNWGKVNVERMDEIGPGSCGAEGDVRFFDLQWCGLHLGIQIGRTPRRQRVTEEQAV